MPFPEFNPITFLKRITFRAGISLDIPELGSAGRYRTGTYDSGVVALATDGAATAITGVIPQGARLIAVAAILTADVEGVNSDTGTLALNGAMTDNLATVDALTAGGKLQGTVPGDIIAESGVMGFTFTLSGGADNIPTAGSIRIVAHYETISPLTV